MPKIDKACAHTNYQILDTRFNKRGLRRRQCRCNQCGHRWLRFTMAPETDHNPWPSPWDMPARRALA